MKLNLTTPIIGLDEKPINSTKEVFVIRKDEKGVDHFEKDKTGKEITLLIQQPEKALTIKAVLFSALLTDVGTLTREEKASRFSLFFRIESSKKDIIELTAEEVALAKKYISEVEGTLIAGRACRILEGK